MGRATLCGAGRSRNLAEVSAILAGFTSQPSAARRAAINTAVAAFKTAGIWSKLDVFFMLHAHDAQAARVNWKNPGTFDLAVVGSPVFTADQSYAGDGVAAQLTSAYVPSAGGNQYAQDNAHTGMWVYTPATYDGVTTKLDLFTLNGRMGRRGTTNNTHYTYRVNDGTNNNAAATGLNGHIVAQRTASNARGLHRNGVAGSSDTIASTAEATTFELLGTTAVFSDVKLSCAHAGASFTPPELADFHTILTAFGLTVS